MEFEQADINVPANYEPWDPSNREISEEEVSRWIIWQQVIYNSWKRFAKLISNIE